MESSATVCDWDTVLRPLCACLLHWVIPSSRGHTTAMNWHGTGTRKASYKFVHDTEAGRE